MRASKVELEGSGSDAGSLTSPEESSSNRAKGSRVASRPIAGSLQWPLPGSDGWRN